MDDADYLLFNARIHTIHEALPVAEALAIRGDRIAAVGSNRSLLQAFPGARRLDAQNLTIVPGFIDAHMHLMGFGESKREIDLEGATSVEEVVSRLKAHADRIPSGEWLIGRGWDQNRWAEAVMPTRAPLDAAFPDRPVWLRRVDRHVGWANTAAMDAAGVGENPRDPAGGRVLRDDRGAPTGLFLDLAMVRVEDAIPPRDEASHRQSLRAAVDALHGLGITGVHDAGAGLATIERYRRAADEGQLGLRVHAMIDGRGDAFDHFCEHGLLHLHRNLLNVRAVKYFLDGALGSRGAALLADYTDDPGNRGLLRHDADAFVEHVRAAAKCGLQVCTHAIGDQAVRLALDAYERGLTDDERRTGRHRIEHAQIVHEADMPRLGAQHVVASMQPVHATSDMAWVEARLGVSRLKGAYAWRSLADGGAPIAFGSDAPVASPNPLLGIHAAVTRTDLEGRPEGGWLPEERVTAAEALRYYTWGAAFAGFQEQETGSLVTGKLADFVVLSEDLLRVPPEDIPSIRIVATFQGGRRVAGGW